MLATECNLSLPFSLTWYVGVTYIPSINGGIVMRDFLELIRAGLNWRDLAAAASMSAFLIMLAIWLPEVVR